MKKKASYCIDCQRRSLHGEYSEKLECLKGHRPRFYKPKNPKLYWAEDYGWKRICSDYKRRLSHVKQNQRQYV